MKTLLPVSTLLAVLSVVATANAGYIYTFQGPTYTEIVGGTLYDTSMSISGSMEIPFLPDPATDYYFRPTTFSFFDGVNTITEANATKAIFSVESRSNRDIDLWGVSLTIEPDSPMVGDTRKEIMFRSTHTTLPIFDQLNAGQISTCASVLSDGHCIWVVTEGGINNTTEGAWTTPHLPLPAAAWFLGSGLIGLIGIARKKAA